MKECRILIDKTSKISLRRQCELLEINRSSLYYEYSEESTENLQIMRIIDEYHLKYPTKGVLRMQDYLISIGYQINEKRVRRLMRLMDIYAIFPKKNLSKMYKSEYKMPYLLRGLKIYCSNQVWEIDITYIPMAKGFMYLIAIIDVYSRFVVGWGISNTLDSAGVHKVVKDAIKKYGPPEIINSDQGCQFTCKDRITLLSTTGIKISMDGKGRAIDNVYIERLWRSVKYDYVYLHPALDGLELFKGLTEYFKHYNYVQAHQGIGRQIPVKLFKNVA